MMPRNLEKADVGFMRTRTSHGRAGGAPYASLQNKKGIKGEGAGVPRGQRGASEEGVGSVDMKRFRIKYVSGTNGGLPDVEK